MSLRLERSAFVLVDEGLKQSKHASEEDSPPASFAHLGPKDEEFLHLCEHFAHEEEPFLRIGEYAFSHLSLQSEHRKALQVIIQIQASHNFPCTIFEMRLVLACDHLQYMLLLSGLSNCGAQSNERIHMLHQ